MREITLTQGLFALVDDEDFDRLSQYKWHAQKIGHTYYACCWFTVNGKRDRDRIHRMVLGLSKGDGKLIDHINGDGLDNRKCNLRFASYSLNGINSRLKKNSMSGYRGVKQDGHGWMARITRNGKTVYLGKFPTVIDAAYCYDRAAIELYGSNARLNFLEAVNA